MQNAISLFNQAFYFINSTDLSNNDEKTIEIFSTNSFVVKFAFFPIKEVINFTF